MPKDNRNGDFFHSGRMAALPCIVCHKELNNVIEGADNQPNDGVACYTHGNYGSRVFDDLGGHHLDFNICDECLIKASEQGRVALGFLGSVVGVPLKLWTPGLEDEYPSPELKEEAIRKSKEMEAAVRKASDIGEEGWILDALNDTPKNTA